MTKFKTGDRVIDYRTYQIAGQAHLGFVTYVSDWPENARFGYRVSVVWDSDITGMPEDGLWSDDLARVVGDLVG